MKKEQYIKVFAQLGSWFKDLAEKKTWEDYSNGVTEEEHIAFQELIARQKAYNGWFTEDMVQQALSSWANALTEEKLTKWLENYSSTDNPKRVAIIMAGNIPLVGFHDFLSVLMTGNIALCKMSSDDKTLLPAIVRILVKWMPELESKIQLSEGKINDIEAVIATGSDNSQLFFKEYFGKYPHVFRKNRTSVAVLTGNETPEELHKLGHDIFDYYGLGCRNVSHLLLPKGYKLDAFFEGIYEHKDVIYHKKYGNNYDYNKAIYLMNQEKLLDNNFVLLKESKDLYSPLGMLHYHFYSSSEEIDSYLQEHKEQVQAVVGQNHIPFGKAQSPALDDYADGVNTLEFLKSL